MSPNHLSRSLKDQVRKRAKGCCEYCWSQEKFSTHAFSIEHIYPISKGGKTEFYNLALACQGCNNYKYNKVEGNDPVNQKIVPFYNPITQNWQDHFSWSDDYTLIIGLTPTGRATVESIKLNRQGLVNLRKILYSMGEHPPLIN